MSELKGRHVMPVEGAHMPQVETLRAGNLDIMAFTRVGKDHANGISEDSYRVVTLDDGTIIIALADGLGDESSPFSADGAQIATGVTTDFIAANIKSISNQLLPGRSTAERRIAARNNVVSPIAKAWKEAIQRKSKNGDSNYMEYATTLMAAVIGHKAIAVIKIGHNDAFQIDERGIASSIQIGKPVSDNTTVSIAHSNPQAYSDYVVLPRTNPFQPLLLTTDAIHEITRGDDQKLKQIMTTSDPVRFAGELHPTNDDLTAILIQQSKTS